MRGMNRTTGQSLDGVEHIRQSVHDILTTPLGSRVMRRDYGSLVPVLLDQPLNDATVLRVYAASVMAIIRWEPRVTVQSIQRIVSALQTGRMLLSITGQTRDNASVNLEVPVA